MFGCNQDITVWNVWRNPDDKNADDVFYRHILPVKGKYKTKINKTVTGAGISQSVLIANSQIVIIPDTEFYKPPGIWESMGEDDRTIFFTLSIGDLVALGKIYIDISGIAPFKVSDVRQLLAPDVFSIKAIANNARIRNGRHYKVEGV